MAHLYAAPPAESSYARRNWQGSPEEYQHALDTSCTVYVGNLSFYTREEQIWELFSKVGQVKRIVMGLNKRELTPCGFCFVEYYTHEAAEDCVNYVSGTKLDERIVRADWDTGFVEGRQFGRGSSGGQVRDDFRDYYDPERGDKNLRGGKGAEPLQGPPPGRQGPPHHDSQDRFGMPAPHHNLSPREGKGGASPGRHSSPQQGRGSCYGHPPDEGRGRYDDRYEDRYEDRYDDRYGHRESRRDGRDGGGWPNDRNPDYRQKRGREEYDRGSHHRGHHDQPLVDEFGRDIPPTKRAKPSENGR